MYAYDWVGYGLELTLPSGTVFLQGEEADELYDVLEAAETNEDVQRILEPYDEIAG